jgi:hypothetical protein
MSKAIRNEIEKATFLDGKGKKIIRIGEGLDKDYGDHCDDRNVMCFFAHRWLPRLKEMKTAKEVEKQIDDFFNKIPSLAGTEEERKIMTQLRELGLVRKMVSAPVVAEAMMNNIRLSDFNNNNGMFNNEGKLIYLPNNNSNSAAAASKGGRRRRKTRRRKKKKYKKRRKTRKYKTHKHKKKHRRRTSKRR